MTAAGLPYSLDFTTLRERYAAGTLKPTDVVGAVYDHIGSSDHPGIWIHLLSREEALAQAEVAHKRRRAGEYLPLYGLPFAIKDNIDVAGHPTTAACPAFRYTAGESARVVAKLLEAGAILIGKTNLDQFATGLVGTRSPYGPCANAFDQHYIAGGSSSGSAVAVAGGYVSFALGTDTAGSGRVPAGFNNIIGLKPTRGLISTAGVVPACRSLDCISIFALTARDAMDVWHAAVSFDCDDPYAREIPLSTNLLTDNGSFRFGIPQDEQLEFFGDADSARLFREAVAKLRELGGAPVKIDYSPFCAAADLLYNGPWLAERYATNKNFFRANEEALHPIVRQVIAGAAQYSAADVFEGSHRLEQLKREAAHQWKKMDVLVLPTAGTIYSIDDVQAAPYQLNTNLGYYTNFVNLMDLCALAVPAGFRADGLPFGITLIAPAFHDEALCALGETYHRHSGARLGATPFELSAGATTSPPRKARGVRLAVAGAHLSGLPLNQELIERGARLAKVCRTANNYRLYALANTTPPKPGLVRGQEIHGNGIEIEVWELPEEEFGGFVAAIPPPLAMGSVTLDDGEVVKGFVCEPYAVNGARDISNYGGWRNYLASWQSTENHSGGI
jgi:allophanate hydrolase